MPRRKFIDKKNATTFALVFRPQNDPLIHDEDASDMVFKSVEAPNAAKLGGGDDGGSGAKKIKTRRDLEDEFRLDFRANEGQAASYGIYYDDTEYNYMQHMADSTADGEGFLVEAPLSKKATGKHQARLEDKLRALDLEPVVAGTTYQNQQDVPDDIAGFQPDMDPRLREALEALDDDAYVDDEEDIFAELASGGEMIDRYEWEEMGEDPTMGEEEDGWETDDTVRATSKKKSKASGSQTDSSIPAVSECQGEDWMVEFDKFQKASRRSAQEPAPAASTTDLQSGVSNTSSIFGGRRKKRKGALTSNTGFSMTSSSLARTDEQSLLDLRFDKLVEEYAGDGADCELDDNMSITSGMTGASSASRFSRSSKMPTGSGTLDRAPQLMASDMNDMLDEFLGNYSTRGKRGRVVRGKQHSGLEELDELRKELGPARLRTQRA